MSNRSTLARNAVRFSEQTDHEARALESEELAELEYRGVNTQSYSVRTSKAFRTSEWAYLTEQDLADAVADYAARLEAVKRDVTAKRLTGAVAKRALRNAEHALTVAERQTLDGVTREDDTDYDPMIADMIIGKCATGQYVMPSSDAILITSKDPMAVTRWSADLEHAATMFLHAHGVRTTSRPDVLPRFATRRRAISDRVAFKGQARYALPKPCRVGSLGNEPAELGNVETHVTELLVTPRFVLVDGVLTLNNGRVRKAWRGHRSILVRLSSRRSASETTRKARRAQSVATDNVAKRGPARDPWNLSPRSIPARLKATTGATELALRLESVLRTSAYGSTLSLSDGTTVSLTDVSLSTVQYRDVAYPVRELSRRAALAGLTVE